MPMCWMSCIRVLQTQNDGPVFLIDHPYEMKPLAKRKSGDPSKVASVALVVAGFEIFNAYNELNDPQDQRERWEEEKSC